MPTKLHIRMNDGSELYINLNDDCDHLKEAKKYRNVDAYMVCVEHNGIRTLRWDRSQIVENNHWRRVAPHNFETLGKLPIILRVK